MDIGTIVFRQILMMFLMMSVGVICYKIGMITKSGSNTLSNVALFVVLPMVVFTSFQIEYNDKILREILLSFVLGILAHLVGMALAYLLVRGGDKEKRILERFHIIYPNCGFMGLPIAQAMYGEKGVIYITAFMCAQNVLIWSHGVSTMQGGFKKESLLGILKAPVIIAMILGLVCFLFQIPLPDVLVDSAQTVGSMNTPLAMIVSGTAIAQSNIIKALTNIRLYYMVLVRLLVVPLVVVGLLSLIHVSKDLRIVTALGISAPTAAITTMFAVKYQKDVGYAAELFSFCTLLAIVSMPLIVSLAEGLF